MHFLQNRNKLYFLENLIEIKTTLIKNNLCCLGSSLQKWGTCYRFKIVNYVLNLSNFKTHKRILGQSK